MHTLYDSTAGFSMARVYRQSDFKEVHMVNKEYKICKFYTDMEAERIFLPEGAVILEVIYEAVSKEKDFVAPIGGQDRLQLFNIIKKELRDIEVPVPKPKGKYA